MPFMKVLKKVKGVKAKKGAIVLIEDEEIRDNVSVDVDGNEYPTNILAPLTEEEAAKCLSVKEIPL